MFYFLHILIIMCRHQTIRILEKSKPEILVPDGNFFEKFTPALQPYVPNNSALGESVPPNNSPLGTVYLLTIHTVGLYTS